MSAGNWARIGAVLFGGLMAGLGTSGVVATAQPASAAAYPATAAPSLATTFRSCVAGSGSADIVLLMDESGSLKDSDPKDVRVQAASLLINGWSREAQQPNADVNVKLMGFSDNAENHSPWLSAKGGIAQIRQGVAAFAGRDSGAQTDYLMALDGARRELAARADRRPNSCQAIVWLTDGQLDAFARYEVDGKSALKPYLKKDVSNAAATQAAAAELCRAGGVADQIRSAGVSLFAVGLASANTPAARFELMRSVALGGDGTVPCGNVPAQGLGSFQLANNLDDLFFIFHALGHSGAVVEQQTKICQGTLSPACAHSFVLDDSITGVDALASAGAPGLQMWLTPPGGRPVEIRAKSQSVVSPVGGASVVVKDEGHLTTSLLMTRRSAWSGPWALQYLDPARKTANLNSRSSIELTANVRPTIELPKEGLRTGAKSGPLHIGLVRADGSAIDPKKLLGSVGVVAVIVDGAGATVLQTPTLDAAGLARPLVVDLTKAAPGAGRIELRVLLKTADFAPPKAKPIAGTVLAPIDASFPLTLSPPLGYVIIPTRAAFGSFVGPVNSTINIPLGGEGCVWIDPTSFVVTARPADVDNVSIASPHNSADTCLMVPPGSKTTLPVTLTSVAGVGGLAGSIKVHLVPNGDPSKATVQPLQVSADLDRKPQVLVGWTIFIVAIALALAIPIGLLYLMKWRSGVIPGRALVGGLFSITVRDGQVLREGAPFALRPSDLRDSIVIPARGIRKLSVGEASLNATQGWSPLGTGRVHAIVPGTVGVSDVAPTPHSSGRAELPLALHNHWAIFRSPTGSGQEAQFLLLMGGERSRADMTRSLEDILERVPDAMERLGPRPGHQPLADDGPTYSGLTDPDEDPIGSVDPTSWSDPHRGFSSLSEQLESTTDRSGGTGTPKPSGDSTPAQHDFASFWEDDADQPKT